MEFIIAPLSAILIVQGERAADGGAGQGRISQWWLAGFGVTGRKREGGKAGKKNFVHDVAMNGLLGACFQAAT